MRGIAAVLVVVAHLLGADSLGRFGVTTFFIVSGFVIPLTLERRGSLRAFAINRLFRLYPAYWLSIVAISLWLILFKPHDGYSEIFERNLTRNLIVNATMLQGFFRISDAIVVYWTLTAELAFYVASAVLFRLGYLRQSLRTAWCIIGFVFILTVAGPFVTHHRVPFKGIYAAVALFFGTAVYRHYEGLVSAVQLRRLTAGAVGLALAGVACNYYLFANHSTRHVPVGSALAYAAAFCLFFMLYANRLRRFPNVLLWLGSISYSVYLLHLVVSKYTDSLWPVSLRASGGSRAADALIVMLGTLALSTITYKWIETPAIKLGHQLSRGIQAKLRRPPEPVNTTPPGDFEGGRTQALLAKND